MRKVTKVTPLEGQPVGLGRELALMADADSEELEALAGEEAKARRAKILRGFGPERQGGTRECLSCEKLVAANFERHRRERCRKYECRYCFGHYFAKEFKCWHGFKCRQNAKNLECPHPRCGHKAKHRHHLRRHLKTHRQPGEEQ